MISLQISVIVVVLRSRTAIENPGPVLSYIPASGVKFQAGLLDMLLELS